MSHNKITVSGQSPNTDGDITLNVTDVTDATASNNTQLGYKDNVYKNVSLSSTNKTLYYAFMHNRSESTYTTAGNYVTGDFYAWRNFIKLSGGWNPIEYRDSSITRNNATTTNTPFNSAGWAESLTLSESGTYMFVFKGTFGANFTTSDEIVMQLSDGTNDLSAKKYVFAGAKYSDFLFGVFTISASTTIKMILSDLVGDPDVIETNTRTKTLSLELYKFN
jgi:hypothetical protein